MVPGESDGETLAEGQALIEREPAVVLVLGWFGVGQEWKLTEEGAIGIKMKVDEPRCADKHQHNGNKEKIDW